MAVVETAAEAEWRAAVGAGAAAAAAAGVEEAGSGCARGANNNRFR